VDPNIFFSGDGCRPQTKRFPFLGALRASLFSGTRFKFSFFSPGFGMNGASSSRFLLIGGAALPLVVSFWAECILNFLFDNSARCCAFSLAIARRLPRRVMIPHHVEHGDFLPPVVALPRPAFPIILAVPPFWSAFFFPSLWVPETPPPPLFPVG